MALSLTSVILCFYMKALATQFSSSNSRVHVCVWSDLFFNLQCVCVSEGCGDTHLSDEAGEQSCLFLSFIGFEILFWYLCSIPLLALGDPLGGCCITPNGYALLLTKVWSCRKTTFDHISIFTTSCTFLFLKQTLMLLGLSKQFRWTGIG